MSHDDRCFPERFVLYGLFFGCLIGMSCNLRGIREALERAHPAPKEQSK